MHPYRQFVIVSKLVSLSSATDSHTLVYNDLYRLSKKNIYMYVRAIHYHDKNVALLTVCASTVALQCRGNYQTHAEYNSAILFDPSRFRIGLVKSGLVRCSQL